MHCDRQNEVNNKRQPSQVTNDEVIQPGTQISSIDVEGANKLLEEKICKVRDTKLCIRNYDRLSGSKE